MSKADTRQVQRDSLLLLAQLRVDGLDAIHRIKVRNLSAGGMMAEGEAKVMRGSLVSVELRNIGWIEGTVAWKQDNRFGIAFVDEIDPRRVREPQAAGEGSEFTSPRYTRNVQPAPPPDPKSLRKL